MSSLSLDVEIDLSGFEGLFDKAAIENAQVVLTETVFQSCQKLIPCDTGDLADSGMPCWPDKTDITWTQPYAGRIYNLDDGGTNWTDPNKYHTEPHSHWFEVAKQRDLEKWKDVAAEVLTGGA